MRITIDQNIWLEQTAEKHAEGLFVALNSSRAQLSEFLPWVPGMQTVDDFIVYIKKCELLYQQGIEVSFVIMLDDRPVGRIGLHYLNVLNQSAAIGYWLAESAQGRGIMIRACKAVIDYGFKELALHRIEIKAATSNLKSQAIPRKLGFQQEGILRHAEKVNGKFLDLVLYAILDQEWAMDR
nr:GNAT family protein [Pedobacter panaciterrae]